MTLTVSGAGISAQQAYDSYAYDSWGDPIPSQAGYIAREYIDGNTLGCGPLSAPSDMYVTDDGDMYVLDKGNRRVVILDRELNYVRSIEKLNFDEYKKEHPEIEFETAAEAAAEAAEDDEESSAADETVSEEVSDETSADGGEVIKPPKKQSLILKGAMGICVGDDGTLYIADTENSRVVICDGDGNVKNLLLIPGSDVYNAETFVPRKIVIDKAKNVYVVASNPRGALIYNNAGEFTGFFGANRVAATAEVAARKLWSLFSSEKQLEGTIKSTAAPISNIDIDKDGFVYTVSETTNSDTDIVKKLNAKGINIIPADDYFFGDLPSTYYSIYAKSSMLTDIDIANDGTISILDYQHGRIFQYDKEFWLLFIVGGTGEQLGTFRNPSAVETYENMLYVLDSRKNNITVFERTDFGEVVTKATTLLNDGYYDEAVEPWQEVIKRDGNYRRAYIGIGNALLNSGEYKEAMKYFKISISRWRYDRAYEGYRSQVMRASFDVVVIVLAIIIAAVIAIRIISKKGVLPDLRLRLPQFRGRK